MLKSMADLLASDTSLLGAALVSLVVSTGISFLMRRWEISHTADTEYRFEQRKRLRELIGRHHGRLLSAAASMNYRLRNLYCHEAEGWLSVDGEYANPENYYFRSTLYRFLNVCAEVRMLEEEALLLDARIAEKSDFLFLNYAAALHWVMTDVALMHGLEVNYQEQTDHFFADTFRQYCDSCINDRRFLNQIEFGRLLASGEAPVPVLKYFDGLSRSESPLRWDRLVAFHLLLMAFVTTFGYKRQKMSARDFEETAAQANHLSVLRTLTEWLPRHEIGEDEGGEMAIQAMQRACKRRL